MNTNKKLEYQAKFDELSRRIKKIVNDPYFISKLSESINSTSRIIETISKTDTNHWASQVVNDDNNPILSEEDQIQYEKALEPYLKNIRNLFSTKKDTYHGGVEESIIEEPGSISEESSTSSQEVTDTQIDPDELFNSFIQKMQTMDQSLRQFSSKHGILKLQNDYDKTYKNDIHLIPQPIRTALKTYNPIFENLDYIKAPLRFIIFLIFLYLDVTRIIAGVSGLVTTQKILSSVLALLEFLRGDWKKSLLTFIGIFGTTPLLVGQFIKIYLYLFEKLSPTLQERIVYGSWDALKSFILGVLLSILQITAPFSIREKISNVLTTLREGKQIIDKKLEEAGYKPRQDFFSPTWDDLNNLQAVNDDPVFLCSKEYQDLINEQDESSPLLRIILQLLRIPIDKDIRTKITCSQFPCPKTPLPYLELLKLDRTNKTPSTPSTSSSSPAPAPATSVPAPATSVPSPAASVPVPASAPAVLSSSTPLSPAFTSVETIIPTTQVQQTMQNAKNAKQGGNNLLQERQRVRRGGKKIYNKI
jgi:hypothetical protein